MTASFRALDALIRTYDPASAQAMMAETEPVFKSKEPFLTKVKLFDQAVNQHPTFAPVAGYMFDLLMSAHLEAHQSDERYFDSMDWQEIEDRTLERGTELLNILLYLAEAKEHEVDIELDDFLNEFLLIDEDEFQDEHHIYEALIDHADIVDESPAVIIEAVKSIGDAGELEGLLLPFLLFFNNQQGKDIPFNLMRPEEHAVYICLTTYYTSIN